MSVKSRKIVPSVIIVGGGFAGTEIARKLAEEGGVNVTIISNKSYFEYYPAFYRVVTGAAPIDVCVPLSDLVPAGVDIVIDRIEYVDLEKKEITSEKGQIFTADYIILAVGSQTSYFNLPGLSEFSFGFKSISEAVRLKEHIKNLFVRKTNQTENQNDKVTNFQIVIVGGGASGVEVAGDLTRHMQKLASKFKVDPSFITIDIIERGNRLISATKEKASELAMCRLCKLGVNVFLNRAVQSEEIEKIFMGDISLKTKTVIWTAGTSINELYLKTKGFQFDQKKKVVVDDFLCVPEFNDIYIAGDGAGTKYSGLAQTAIYDGKFIAKDIIRRIKNNERKIYNPKVTNYIIPIGHNWAIMSFGKIHISGYFAYLFRQAVDFWYFASILSLRKTRELFWKGRKYKL